jgi:hypothetical protein
VFVGVGLGVAKLEVFVLVAADVEESEVVDVFLPVSDGDETRVPEAIFCHVTNLPIAHALQ